MLEPPIAFTFFSFQVCDLQAKVKHFSRDNEDLRASVCAYRDTQEDLTAELCDFKEKYREIADLLHDTQEELKKSRKRTYPGAGQHSIAGMFTTPAAASSAAASISSAVLGSEDKGRTKEMNG